MSESGEFDIEDELPDFSKDPRIEEAWTWTILRCKCPHCKQVNYLNLGDMEDPTAPCIDVLDCWHCGKKAWIVSPEEAECAGLGTSIEEFESDQGKERP